MRLGLLGPKLVLPLEVLGSGFHDITEGVLVATFNCSPVGTINTSGIGPKLPIATLT
jgi:hypothetical protein